MHFDRSFLDQMAYIVYRECPLGSHWFLRRRCSPFGTPSRLPELFELVLLCSYGKAAHQVQVKRDCRSCVQHMVGGRRWPAPSYGAALLSWWLIGVSLILACACRDW